jgi:hypothetical protein
MASTETNLAKTPRTASEGKFVIGSRERRPAHRHACGHECNSPYCENPADINCPEDGGPDVIVQGYEPWRGRS